MAANPQTTTLHKTNQTLTSTEPVGAPEAVAALDFQLIFRGIRANQNAGDFTLNGRRRRRVGVITRTAQTRDNFIHLICILQCTELYHIRFTNRRRFLFRRGFRRWRSRRYLLGPWPRFWLRIFSWL